MNKLIRALAVGTALLSVPLAGCDKRLDIEPVNTVRAANALNTSADVQSLLRAGYATIGSVALYGGALQYTADLLGDPAGDAAELFWQGTYPQPGEIYRKDISKTNSFVSGTWIQAYQAINIANTVLANLGKVPVAGDKARVEGEAKFIRGAMYFELVRLFGKDWNDGSPTTNLGVPVILTPTNVEDPTSVTGAAAKVKRNTVAEVYTQAISDLTDAETLLKATAPSSATANKFATTYAAAGMLSRVYLQQSKFMEAAVEADRVASAKTPNGDLIYRLINPIADEFTSEINTNEDIFDTQVNVQSGANDLDTFYSTNGRGGDISVNDAHLALYEADDQRAQLFNQDNGTLTTKFDNPFGNVHLIRLSEMLLTRAEGNFRAGTSVGADPVDDINQVRKRAGLAPLAAADLTLDKILLERHLELAFEGFYLHDLRRNKIDVGDLPYNDGHLLFPIPQREIDINSNLEQNEAYK